MLLLPYLIVVEVSFFFSQHAVRWCHGKVICCWPSFSLSNVAFWHVSFIVIPVWMSGWIMTISVVTNLYLCLCVRACVCACACVRVCVCPSVCPSARPCSVLGCCHVLRSFCILPPVRRFACAATVCAGCSSPKYGLIADRYHFCEKCFNEIQGNSVTLGDDPAQPQT